MKAASFHVVDGNALLPMKCMSDHMSDRTRSHSMHHPARFSSNEDNHTIVVLDSHAIAPIRPNPPKRYE